MEREQNYAFLEFLKVIMAHDRRIETVKEVIAKHAFFNASDLFYELDENKDGLVNAEEFSKGCLSGVNVVERGDLDRFLQLAGANEDGEISSRDFCAAIAPQRVTYSSSYGRDFRGREENKRSAIGSLCELIRMVAQADIDITEARDGLELAGEELFDRMD